MSKKTKRTVGWVAFYIFVAAFVVLLLLPFIWQFLTSVKPLNEIAEMPAKWIPSYFHGQFYVNVFTKHPFARYMLNSLIVATSATLLSLLIGASAAYALSRLHFKGRAVLLMVILGVSMFPTIATLSPLYLILKNMNLLNTYAALILPSIIVPLGTFILTQSFKSVPDTVLDAAMLDGCGVLRMLFYVVSPMNKSGLVCVLLLSFLDAWNMVEQPIAFLKEAEQYPISVALAYTPPSETSVQLVCCILVVLPALFLFTFFNRELVEGIVLAEVK